MDRMIKGKIIAIVKIPGGFQVQVEETDGYDPVKPAIWVFHVMTGGKPLGKKVGDEVGIEIK